jgi:hypothetical protein
MSRPLITGACRAALLMMSGAPLSYGRTLISVEALHELTQRSFQAFVCHGCHVSRLQRMESVIVGRQRQIYDLLREAGQLTVAWPYVKPVDSMGVLHTQVQVAAAAEAIDSMLEKEHGNAK